MGRHLFDKAWRLDLDGDYYPIWGIDNVENAATNDVVYKTPDGRLSMGPVPIPSSLGTVGFGAQFGDGSTGMGLANLQADFKLPWAGTIVRTILVADIACSAIINVKRNNVSIFSSTSYKPTLASSSVDDESNMTGISTIVEVGDEFLFNLDSVSGAPTRLTLTIFVLRS